MGASGISRRFHWHSLNGDGRYYSDASNFVSNLTQQELMQSINDDEILIQSLQETLKVTDDHVRRTYIQKKQIRVRARIDYAYDQIIYKADPSEKGYWQKKSEQHHWDKIIGKMGPYDRRRLVGMPADFEVAMQQFYDNHGRKMQPFELVEKSKTLSKRIGMPTAFKYFGKFEPQKTAKPTESSLPVSQAQKARASLNKIYSRKQAQQALGQQREDRAQAISDQGAAAAAATAQWRVNHPEEWRATQADGREKQRQHDQEITERAIPLLRQDTY